VWEIAVFGDDFEAGDGFGVTDDVVEVDRAVLFDPVVVMQSVWVCMLWLLWLAYQGSS